MTIPVTPLPVPAVVRRIAAGRPSRSVDPRWLPPRRLWNSEDVSSR